MKTPWHQAERETLRLLYPDMVTADIAALMQRSLSSVTNQSHLMGLKKSAELLSSAASGRIAANPGHPFTASQIQKGAIPWNKGKNYHPGGRCRETQFKAGSKPQTWLPIGTERVNKDGHLVRKVSDTGNRHERWKRVDQIEWEAINGPLPDGHFLVKTPEGHKAFTRADLMRQNTYHRYPPEVAKLIQLRGALNRQINKHTRP